MELLEVDDRITNRLFSAFSIILLPVKFIDTTVLTRFLAADTW